MIENLVKKYKRIPVQVRAAWWFLICSFLQKGISTITTPIFTRLLTTSEYGEYSAFNSWLDIVSIFVTLEVYAGVYVQGLVKFDHDRETFTSSLMGLVTALSLGWTFVYLVAQDFWNNVFALTTVQMLAMLVMIWATAIFRFWSAKERVVYSYRRLVLLTIAVSVAKPLVGIIGVYYANDKVTARILSLTIVELIGYTGLFLSQLHRNRTVFNAVYWKYAVLFNIPLIPHYLSQIVLSSSDRLMIKSMVGSSEAGIYSLAYSMSMIMTLFNTALRQTIEPWMYQKIKEKNVDAIARIAYISFSIIAALNLLLILVAPEAVSLFAPKAYHSAIWVIPPVAMGVFFAFSYNFFSNFEFYFEKRKFIMIASVIGALLNVVLNYIFIPLYGYYAAGYTTLVCYIAFSAGHYIFMCKTVKTEMQIEQPYNLKILLSIAGLFLLFGFGFMATYTHPFIRYSVIGFIALLSFLKRKQLMGVLKDVLSLKKKR